MDTMREAWSDERLDDLNSKVGDLGRRMDLGFAQLRAEMNARFDRMDARFDRVDERFERMDERFERMDERMDARFEAMQRVMIQAGAVVVAALIGLIATQL